jgi:hypothetical protein
VISEFLRLFWSQPAQRAWVEFLLDIRTAAQPYLWLASVELWQ